METIEDQAFEKVCSALGFRGNVGFLENEADAINLNQKLVLQEAKGKIGIDAVYFIQTAINSVPIPVIYFKKLRAIDSNQLRDLHKRIWNQGRTPLLLVISPTEISLYNCYEPPPKTLLEDLDAGKRLIKRLSIIADEEEIRQKLGDYSREKINIGSFLSSEDRFNAENRADQYLLRNLRYFRGQLVSTGLHYKYVHSLIGRSIFILYLQDRGALSDFLKSFRNGRYSRFIEILPNKEDTYELFRLIAKHFNGDMFPVTEDEQNCVTSNHLTILRAFLRGRGPDGQERLWPYSFDVIPIEFISSIYEEFFFFENNKSKKRKTTAHYTPLFLADFLLDQVLPSKNERLPTILDPSCGSGIFLVAAFRRLVAQVSESKQKLTPEILRDILCHNIFGVDINGEAIRVAAFSLYLTMLDYLEPKSLWQREGLFPKLIGKNLFGKNFFEVSSDLGATEFDIIVGNTPWESGQHVLKSLKDSRLKDKAIGDKQLAQAFLWESLKYAKNDSVICLLVTAKGLLFNRSIPNQRFRQQFFNETKVFTIINFSAMRFDLFENAVGPAAAIVYSPSVEKQTSTILYVVPKPSDETRKLGAIIVNDTDIKQIPRNIALTDNHIWKAAMWGTPRDWRILQELKKYPTLRECINKHVENIDCTIGDGFQVNGGDKNERPEMAQLRYIPVELLEKFHIPLSLEKCKWTIFHRPREKLRYTGPLCLIKAAPINGEVIAAYTTEDTSYDSNIIGIAGKKDDEWALKIMTTYLNSSIAQYLLFLICSKWGVERDDILVDEFLDLPIALPSKGTDLAKEIIELHDDIVRTKRENDLEKQKILLRSIDEKFYSLFNLTKVEQEIIEDTIKYTISLYQQKGESIACMPTTRNLLVDYAKRVQAVLGTILTDKESIDVTIYTGSKSLDIVSFTLKLGKVPSINVANINVANTPTETEELLLRLRKILTEKVSGKVFFARRLKIYEDRTIYLIKPNESRFWNKQTAYEDADNIIADILQTWRTNSD